MASTLLILSVCPPTLAQQPPASVHTGQPTPEPSPRVARWFDPQAIILSLRYRRIETSSGVVSADEAQHSVTLRGRFKFDPAGRFTLNAGVATGGTPTSGWNSTGLGTGAFAGTLSMKQLYLAASPSRGLDVEYGGLYAVRGETTEVSNLDNDTYVVGERVSVRRPKTLWLDEVTVSLVYLGDPVTPNVVRRLHRLSEVNYRQYLIAKKVNKSIGLSAEYDRYQGTGTVRAGVSLRSPKMRVVDFVRFEQYRRLGITPATGFALYAEKKVLPRLLVTGGYADIDANNQILNGDRYLKGRRLYTLTTVAITSDLSASVYFTHSVNTKFPISTRTRSEVVMSYNGLRPVRRLLGLK